MESSLDNHMTIAEAAEVLDVPRRTVTNRVVAGLIPAEKLPGKTGAYLLDRQAVEALAGRSN